MSLRRSAMTHVFRRLWSLDHARRKQAKASARRKSAGTRRQVFYYHQVSMPHATLAAQLLEGLAAAYDIDIVPRLCWAPDARMIAQAYEEQFYPFMRKDAADIAPYYGLAFDDIGRQPSQEVALRGSRILAGSIDSPDFLELAPKVDAAVWSEDEAALDVLAKTHAPLDEATTRSLMTRHEAERLNRGYVYAGAFYFEAEWFFGPDRLNYLEDRLVADGAARAGASVPVVDRPEIRGATPSGAEQVSLEMFASVRSPYTHEAFQRVLDIAKSTGCRLVPRPVRPIIMRFERTRARFCQVRYVYYDAAREAERYGVPQSEYYEMAFEPTERIYSLFAGADDQAKGLELLYSFTLATFAEGMDGGKDATMRHVVERIGLSWTEAEPLLGRPGWLPQVQENERIMLGEGLWGVPSFRVTGPEGRSFSTWGADRLWLLEAKIAEFSG